MNQRFHGVLSLVFISIAVIIALIYMQSHSNSLGLLYLLIILLSVPMVIFSYCAKCTCKDRACSHVLPGMLTRLLPERKQGPYTKGDYFWTAVSLAALLGFPLFWLWQSKPLFVVYSTLLLIGLLEILLLVCRACSNQNCPVSTRFPNLQE